MPVMGGAEFLEHFKRLDMGAATPVLVLTAGSEAGAAPWKRTAHGIIRKPVDVEVLLEAIEQAVRAA
jgi:CheY-like chemotaxis protein